MKKTVTFELSDDFKFPEFWEPNVCGFCPFNTVMYDEPTCFLTEDDGSAFRYDTRKLSVVKTERPKCPFFCGADVVSYEDASIAERLK